MKECLCRFCETPIFAGVECVACYRQRMTRCPTCRLLSGAVAAKYRKETCPQCRGERWVLREAPTATPAAQAGAGGTP
jgi:hypothetical protein